jgi:hypothetical protein
MLLKFPSLFNKKRKVLNYIFLLHKGIMSVKSFCDSEFTFDGDDKVSMDGYLSEPENNRPRHIPIEIEEDNIPEGAEIREVKCKSNIEEILRDDGPVDFDIGVEEDEMIPDNEAPFSGDENETRIRHRRHKPKPKPADVLTPEEFAYRAGLLHKIKRHIEEFPDELIDYDYNKIREIIDIGVLENIFASIDTLLSAISGEKTIKEIYYMGTEYMEHWGLSHGWKVGDFALKIRRGKNKDGSPTVNNKNLTRCAILYSSYIQSNALIQLGISTVQCFSHYHTMNKALEQMKRNDRPVSRQQYEAFQDL